MRLQLFIVLYLSSLCCILLSMFSCYMRCTIVAHKHAHTCMQAHTHTYMHTNTYSVHVHASTYTHIHLYIHASTYTHTYTCTYMQARAHTHIHTSRTHTCTHKHAHMYTHRRLADINKDNALSEYEFCVAMKLVMMRRKGCEIPSSLPQVLLPTAIPCE